MIHQANPVLLSVLDALASTGTRIDVETNGTRAPSNKIKEFVDLFVVSPKINPQGDPEKRRIVKGSLEVFKDLAYANKAVFKVVCATPEDVHRTAEWLDIIGVPRSRSWIMPEGITTETLLTHAKEIADTTLSYGFNFSLRQHVLLYGTQRAK